MQPLNSGIFIFPLLVLYVLIEDSAFCKIIPSFECFSRVFSTSAQLYI